MSQDSAFRLIGSEKIREQCGEKVKLLVCKLLDRLGQLSVKVPKGGQKGENCERSDRLTVTA